MASLWDDAVDPYTGMRIQPPEQNAGEPSLWDKLKNLFTPGQASAGDPRAAVTMPPEVGSYLHDLVTGKAAMDSLRQNFGPAEGDQAAFDPAHPLGAQPTESQFERAMNLALGFSGGGLGIRAYHGSPHDFGAFDTAKIGTGEGAQAYGHGLYFAENEGVARGYRDLLAPPPKFGDQIGNAADLVKRFGSEEDAVKALQSALARNPTLQVEIDAIKSGAYKEWKPAGKMYEVDIKAEPEDFLQWDKPLSEQSEKVQKAFGRIVDRDLSQETGWAKLTGEEAYRAVVERAGIRGGGEAALREAGIPGIRYLDQGSRGAGEGTHNYVVFDPKTIEIIRKYGIAGLLGGGAAAGATDGGS